MRKLAVAVIVLVAALWVGWLLLPGPTFAPVSLDPVAERTETPAAKDTEASPGAQTPPASAPAATPAPAPPAASAETPAEDESPADVGPFGGADRRERFKARREAMADGRLPPGRVTPRDLRRDEARGGHTIARHVGKTDDELRERLARESISAASTYPDLETAQRVVGLALRRHAARVEAWQQREGRRPNLVLPVARPPAMPPIGRVLRRGSDEPVEAHAAIVVLRWDDDDFYVLTSYPEERPRGRPTR